MQQRKDTVSDYQKRVNVVVEYINSHLDEDIDLNLLATVSNLSPYHFHRVVRGFLGEPIGAYIVRVRVQTAAKLLRYTSLPICEVALRVGFDVPSSFNKAFRKHFETSPGLYRTSKTIKPMIENQKAVPQGTISLKPIIVDLENRKVIYIRIVGQYGGEEYSHTWERLWAFVKEHKLFTAGIEHLGISHDDPNVTSEDKCRYDAALVVHKPVSPMGEVGVKEVAGGRYARFTYVGPYQGLSDAYNAIHGTWLPQSGLSLRSVPVFERYCNNPKVTAPEKLRTEIFIPVE